MSKKRDEAAQSEPERSETIDEAASVYAEVADVARAAVAETSGAKWLDSAPPKTFEQWAEAKGHIKRLPPPGRPRAAYVQPGPDFRVVKVATQWPANKVVTEDEYDKAVVKTYGADIRER